MKKGFLITFEGIEGSGKSTIISWLSNQLIEKGYDILMCREPGGDIAGQAIREIILDKKYQLTYESELLFNGSCQISKCSECYKTCTY